MRTDVKGRDTTNTKLDFILVQKYVLLSSLKHLGDLVNKDAKVWSIVGGRGLERDLLVDRVTSLWISSR